MRKILIPCFLFAACALAQIPAPQINLTGNLGCQGFPCTNSGTLIFASDANHTMTAQESSAFNIKVTSSVSLTATRNLISPAGRFAFTIENATTGGQAIQIIGPSGTGVTIANGVTVSVWNDGTNYVQAGSNTGVSSINTVPGAFTFGSGSSCTGTTCTFPGTGGTALPITYVCTGSGDLTAINGYLATSGTWLTLDTRSHACATNNQIIMFSTDRLTVLGPNGIMSAMPSAGDGDGNDEASITNEAIVNPTTIARTCTLAAGSTAVTGCSGASFTNADVAESFSCPAALATGVALQTTIGQVTSGTAIVLSDATGSGITPGSFSCTETIRDHDIVIDMTGSQISMTSVYGSAPRPQELAIGHANRVTVMGGNWIDPDGTSDWHQVFFDVSQVLVQNEKFLSFSGYGQDGVNFEGPWRAVTVKDINCDTSDDCVALKPGEWDGAPYNKPFRNTNGAGVGAYISNIQGSSGSHGVAIYAPGCVNPSGTCVSSNVTDVVIDTLVGQAIATDNGYPPSYGIGSPPVGLECLNGAASDCGTVAYADHIRIAHVLGTSPTGSVNGMRVNIGASINMNQYFGNIQISDVGPDGSTYEGDVGAITVTVPTSMSYSTNITTLSIYDSGYTGNHGLFGITSSNATITNFFSDNPNLSLYTFSSATITNEFIAGYYLSGNPLPSLATGYLQWNGTAFVWSAGTGSGCSNALTGAASGGAGPGATFNCSSAATFDYHTFGAAGLGASNTYTTGSQDFTLATDLKIPQISGAATATGQFHFNTTLNEYEGYYGSRWVFPWVAVGGGTTSQCAYWVSAYNLGSQACGSGSGNMSDSSGTTTVGDFPETTSTAHVYSLNTPATVLTQLGAAPALTCTTVSSLAPANNGCYKLSTSASAATPAASAFSIFKITTASGATATLTGTAIADGGNCSAYISGTTFALTGVETAVINSDGTNIWAVCTAASSGVTLQTNSSNNSSQSTYNVINSSTNVAGLTDTVTNTTGGTVQHEIAGIVNVAHGGLGASNSSSTGVVQFASGTESVSTALASGTTATTQAAGDNSTKVQTTAGSNVVYGLVETSGSPFTLSCVSGLYWEASSGAYSWKLCTPPALPSSIQQCFGKSSTDEYVISIIPPTGVTIWYGGSAGTAGSSTGLVSPGTQADYICLVSVGATEYQAIGPGVGGTWVNH